MATKNRYKDKDFLLIQRLDNAPDPGVFKMHTQTAAEIFFFLQGRAVFRVEDNAYPLEPGDLLILRPGEAHYIDVDPAVPYERCVLHCPTDIFQSVDPEGYLVKAITNRKAGRDNLYHSYEFTGGTERFLQTMTAREGDPRLNLLSGLMDLLNQLYRIYEGRASQPQEEQNTPEHRIIYYINQNLGKPITLDQLCERFFISKSQLCRMFKRTMGTTVWRYITAMRLVKAQQMIRGGEHPTHVFTRCGFSDYSVFYRAYVKAFGYSPTEEKAE